MSGEAMKKVRPSPRPVVGIWVYREMVKVKLDSKLANPPEPSQRRIGAEYKTRPTLLPSGLPLWARLVSVKVRCIVKKASPWTMRSLFWSRSNSSKEKERVFAEFTVWSSSMRQMVIMKARSGRERGFFKLEI